jgi:hypothetical protein
MSCWRLGDRLFFFRMAFCIGQISEEFVLAVMPVCLLEAL